MTRLAYAVAALAFLIGAPATRAAEQAISLEAHAAPFVSGDGTTLTGYLYKPDGDGPFAAVVMMHGCAGLLTKSGALKAREAMWLKILRGEGYAVLLADSFTDRGYRTICRIKDRPIRPERERPHDAYGALRWLQAQPFIRPGRLALMGWSNGAMAMLWAVRRDAPQRPPGLDHDFRAAIGFYPGCIKIKREVAGYRAALPVLLQIGRADDWTRPKPCIELVEQTNERDSAKMEFDAYEGAYHGFDHPKSKLRTIVTKNSAFRSGQRNVHIGANPAARAMAIGRVKAYLRRSLAD